MKIFILVILLLVLTSCKTNDVPSAINQKTALGTHLSSTLIVNQSTKDTIDQSLTKLFNDARAQGYSANLDYGYYTIIIKNDCILSPAGILSFKLRADEYDGTEFDQHNDNGYLVKDGIGEVFAAEQVITNGGTLSSTYIICNAESDLVYNTTRYGAEHIILYHNNSAEYDRTKFHGNGVGHPIIPIE